MFLAVIALSSPLLYSSRNQNQCSPPYRHAWGIGMPAIALRLVWLTSIHQKTQRRRRQGTHSCHYYSRTPELECVRLVFVEVRRIELPSYALSLASTNSLNITLGKNSEDSRCSLGSPQEIICAALCVNTEHLLLRWRYEVPSVPSVQEYSKPEQ